MMYDVIIRVCFEWVMLLGWRGGGEIKPSLNAHHTLVDTHACIVFSSLCQDHQLVIEYLIIVR